MSPPGNYPICTNLFICTVCRFADGWGMPHPYIWIVRSTPYLFSIHYSLFSVPCPQYNPIRVSKTLGTRIVLFFFSVFMGFRVSCRNEALFCRA